MQFISCFILPILITLANANPVPAQAADSLRARWGSQQQYDCQCEAVPVKRSPNTVWGLNRQDCEAQCQDQCNTVWNNQCDTCEAMAKDKCDECNRECDWGSVVTRKRNNNCHSQCEQTYEDAIQTCQATKRSKRIVLKLVS